MYHPMEMEIATHSSILAWEILWIEETEGLQYMGLQRVGHSLVLEQYQHNICLCRLCLIQIFILNSILSDVCSCWSASLTCFLLKVDLQDSINNGKIPCVGDKLEGQGERLKEELGEGKKVKHKTKRRGCRRRACWGRTGWRQETHSIQSLHCKWVGMCD